MVIFTPYKKELFLVNDSYNELILHELTVSCSESESRGAWTQTELSKSLRMDRGPLKCLHVHQEEGGSCPVAENSNSCVELPLVNVGKCEGRSYWEKCFQSTRKWERYFEVVSTTGQCTFDPCGCVCDFVHRGCVRAHVYVFVCVYYGHWLTGAGLDCLGTQ